MIYQGVRRCDLCSSEILGHGGTDVCYLCRLLVAEDPDVATDEKWSHVPNVLIFPQRPARA